MNLTDFSNQANGLFSIKLESIASGTSYLANGLVIAWGAITFSQVMVFIGTAFAVATYFTSLYFQRRRDRREQEFHQHRIAVELRSAEKAEDRAEIKSWKDDHEATK